MRSRAAAVVAACASACACITACGNCGARGTVAPPDAPVESGQVLAAPLDAAAEAGITNVRARLEYGFGPDGGGLRSILEHGAAYATPEGLRIVLASAPLDCAKGSKAGALAVELVVPPGPERRFFAGAAVGVPVTVRAAPMMRPTPIPAHATRLTLDEIGHRVRGTLAFDDQWNEPVWTAYRGSFRYRASGPFDIPLCGGAPALARAAPPNVSMLTIFDGGPEKQAPPAIVVVRVDRWTLFHYVSAVIFAEGATCARAARPRLVLGDIGGGGEVHRELERVQPATATLEPEAGPERRGWAWIELAADPLDGRPTVRGRVHAEVAGEAALDGPFEARVCVVEPFDAAAP